MALVEKIAAGRIPDTQPSVRLKVQSFVKAVNSLRVCVNEVCCFSSWRQYLMNIKGMSVVNLLREIIMAVNYEEYLKESQKDWTARFVTRFVLSTNYWMKCLLQMGECPRANHLRNGEPVSQDPTCISGSCLVSTFLAVRTADFIENCTNYQA